MGVEKDVERNGDVTIMRQQSARWNFHTAASYRNNVQQYRNETTSITVESNASNAVMHARSDEDFSHSTMHMSAYNLLLAF